MVVFLTFFDFRWIPPPSLEDLYNFIYFVYTTDVFIIYYILNCKVNSIKKFNCDLQLIAYSFPSRGFLKFA